VAFYQCGFIDQAISIMVNFEEALRDRRCRVLGYSFWRAIIMAPPP